MNTTAAASKLHSLIRGVVLRRPMTPSRSLVRYMSLNSKFKFKSQDLTATINKDGSQTIMATFKKCFGEWPHPTRLDIELGEYRWAVDMRPYSEYYFYYSLWNRHDRRLFVNATINLLDAYGNVCDSCRFYKNIPPRKDCGQSWSIPNKSLLDYNTFTVQVIINKVLDAALQKEFCTLVDSAYIHHQPRLAASQQSDNEAVDAVLPSDCHIDVLMDDSGTHHDTEAISNPQIPAHKYVLAQRSPIFRTMLRANTGPIEISDFTEPVVREFVQFLYTDRCAKSALHEHALQLLAMADKYQVPALTAVCERYLIGSLSEENVVQLLGLAIDHQAKELKTKALIFLRVHAKSMRKKGVKVVRGVLREIAAKDDGGVKNPEKGGRKK